MPSFSERNGLVPPKMVQIDSMNEETRRRVYTLCHTYLNDLDNLTYEDDHLKKIWLNVLKKFIDEYELNTSEVRIKVISKEIKLKIINDKFNFVCDLLEGFIKHGFPEKYYDSKSNKKNFINIFKFQCNIIFEEEKFGYRFVNDQIIKITNEEEIKEVEEAANAPEKYSGAREHIKNALKQYAVKPTPIYSKVIQEAINAVESVAKIIMQDDKATLGEALTVLNKKNRGWRRLAGVLIYEYEHKAL